MFLYIIDSYSCQEKKDTTIKKLLKIKLLVMFVKKKMYAVRKISIEKLQ